METVLRNDQLRVAVVAGEGGRVASLRSESFGVEFLFRSGRDSLGLPARLEARFRDGACGGIEECLPSVGPSGETTEGGPVPDHGDFWQLDWPVRATPDGLWMQATGFSRPLSFRKQMSLRESSLVIGYEVENFGSAPVSFLYACHPLLAIEAGDRIVLPEEITSLQVGYSRGGRPGNRAAWPGAPDLSVTLARNDGGAEMLYTDRLRTGWAGLYRAGSGTGLVVRFDTTQMPFLGLWLCYDGWPEGGDEPRQYAVAFEPTVAPCGTLMEAQTKGLAPVLGAGQAFRWAIEFEITPRQMTYAEFCRFCADGKGTP
jgi:galactose mutarotase-like enzyme